MEILTKNMLERVVKYFALMLMIILSYSAEAQISGASSVCTGSTAAYTSQSPGTSFSWSVLYGGAIIGSSTGLSVQIAWNSGRAGRLSLVVSGGESGGGDLQLMQLAIANQLVLPEGGANTYYYNVIINDLSAGTIGGSTTICGNASAGTLSNITSGSGGLYQWQVLGELQDLQMVNGGNIIEELTWTKILGANSATYSPGNLTATKHYRRKISSLACGDEYSNIVTIIVNDNLLPGSIAGNQIICNGDAIATITSSSLA